MIALSNTARRKIGRQGGALLALRWPPDLPPPDPEPFRQRIDATGITTRRRIRLRATDAERVACVASARTYCTLYDLRHLGSYVSIFGRERGAPAEPHLLAHLVPVQFARWAAEHSPSQIIQTIPLVYPQESHHD